jgi:transcriptional regulator with XRE-family HTH domain
MRDLQGLTQKELADVSGVSVRSVAGYEGGAHVRPNTARKLANALDVEVADLVGVDARPKARALSPRDAQPGTALPEDEVLYKATYTPDTFEEVLSQAQDVIRDARRSYVIEGTLQLKLYMNDDSVEVRTESVSPPSSRTRRRRLLTTKTRNGRKTA